MTKIIGTQKIYPKATQMAKDPRNKAMDTLQQAVAELEQINPRRAAHIKTVIACYLALQAGNRSFFLEKISPPLKARELQAQGSDVQAYDTEYLNLCDKIFSTFEQLQRSPELKELLLLSLWAHDLGIPFGIEWEHHLNGREVVKQLIKEAEIQTPLAQLTYLHGFFTDLTCVNLPQDIKILDPSLLPLLLLLGFCDATGRVDKKMTPCSYLGLTGLRHYVKMTVLDNVRALENPENLFRLRWQASFGHVITPVPPLTQADETALYDQAAPTISRQELRTFYGKLFRSMFLNVLLFAAASPKNKAKILTAIYQSYSENNFTGDVLLRPDTDLGLKFSQGYGIKDFIKQCQSHQDIKDLLVPRPESNQIIFLASKLY